MEAQAAIRQRAMELQESIGDLAKFAAQQKKKDAALKDAAARKAAVAATGDGAAGAMAQGTGIPAIRPKRSAVLPEKSDKARSGFSFGNGPGSAESQPAAAAPAGPAVATKAAGPAGTAAAATKATPSFSFDRGSAKPQPAPGAASAAAPPQEIADEKREHGNALFKAGKYAEARAAYSASIAAQPSHLALANRAMAALKLRDFAAAEADCTAAIEVDAAYVKAYQRRAAARAEQGGHLAAIADLEHAVRLQPASKALAAERAAAIDRYHKETGEPRPTQARPIAVRMAADAAAAAASPPAVPSAASAAAAGTAEASRPTDAGRSASAAASPVVSELPAGPAAPLSRTPEAPAAPADVSDATPDAAASNPPEHPTSADAATAAAPAGAASAAAAPAAAHSGRPDSSATAQPAASPASPQPLGAAAAAAPRAAPARSSQTSPQTQLSNGHAVAGAQQTSTAATTMPPSPSTQPVKLARPKTGLDFERTWRTLTGQPELQAFYLLRLRPAELPALFRVCLTAPLLAGMLPPLLSLLADETDADHAVQLLAALPKVPRFDLAVMSLGASSRALLAHVWDDKVTALKDKALVRHLAQVKPKYRL